MGPHPRCEGSPRGHPTVRVSPSRVDRDAADRGGPGHPGRPSSSRDVRGEPREPPGHTATSLLPSEAVAATDCRGRGRRLFLRRVVAGGGHGPRLQHFPNRPSRGAARHRHRQGARSGRVEPARFPRGHAVQGRVDGPVPPRSRPALRGFRDAGRSGCRAWNVRCHAPGKELAATGADADLRTVRAAPGEDPGRGQQILLAANAARAGQGLGRRHNDVVGIDPSTGPGFDTIVVGAGRPEMASGLGGYQAPPKAGPPADVEAMRPVLTRGKRSRGEP